MGFFRYMLITIPAFIAGIAFVVACSGNGDSKSDVFQAVKDGLGVVSDSVSAGSDAHAATGSDCKQWKVMKVDPDSLTGFNKCLPKNSTELAACIKGAAQLPEGWEPFGFSNYTFGIRICIKQ